MEDNQVLKILICYKRKSSSSSKLSTSLGAHTSVQGIIYSLYIVDFMDGFVAAICYLRDSVLLILIMSLRFWILDVVSGLMGT